VRVNVTAILTAEQVATVAEVLPKEAPAIVSIMAGRIADTGRDPRPTMHAALNLLRSLPHARLLWASTREVFNVIQADELGCHAITVPADILRKLAMLGADLPQLCRDTVKMLYDDGCAAGLTLPLPQEHLVPAGVRAKTA
jgi:transaldolase